LKEINKVKVKQNKKKKERKKKVIPKIHYFKSALQVENKRVWQINVSVLATKQTSLADVISTCEDNNIHRDRHVNSVKKETKSLNYLAICNES
jgi:hypothetical protein